MDNIVAVAVKIADGNRRFFLTWGRVFDPVDPTELEKIVLAFSGEYALGGKPIAAEVAYSLQDAAGEPYFFEAFHILCTARVPASGMAFKKWLMKMRREMRKGKHLLYCGLPAQREHARSKFWSMRDTP